MLRATILLLFGGALTCCGALDPFPTAPRAAAPGAPAGQRVAICYNTLKTSLPEVQRQAQQQCPAGAIAEASDTDWYLLNCPLLLPARATFICKPKK